jgi:hypothetical protein
MGLIAQEFTQFLPGLFQQQLETRRLLEQTSGRRVGNSAR